MLTTFSKQLKTNRQLFRVEIRASIAHCNALFRAGLITRLEGERLKNGLWTILKRADFDRNYVDQNDSLDIYGFVETRLFQLINEAANTLKIGRSRPHRAAVALRLWLRDEVDQIVDSLDDFIEILNASDDNSRLAVFGESFKRDAFRFREIARHTNQMPAPGFDPADESTAEIDFEIVAHELGFEKVSPDAVDSANDRDFCIEFASAAALTGLHLSNLATANLSNFDKNSLIHRQALEMIRGRAVKTFGHPTVLLSLLKGATTEAATTELDEVCEVVFEASDVLKSCLEAATAAFKN